MRYRFGMVNTHCRWLTGANTSSASRIPNNSARFWSQDGQQQRCPLGKRHKELFTTIWTANPRKSLPQITALYILVYGAANDRTPKSIFRLEPLCVKNTL
jgi:hypothetical protein